MTVLAAVSYLHLHILKLIVISLLPYFLFQIMRKQLNSAQILQKLCVLSITGLYRLLYQVHLMLYLLLKCQSFLFWRVWLIHKYPHSFYLVIYLNTPIVVVFNMILKLIKLLLKSVKLLNWGEFSHKSLHFNQLFFSRVLLLTGSFEIVVHVKGDFVV